MTRFCYLHYSVLLWFNPLYCFFGIGGHLALDRNPEPGYNTLLLRLIPGDLLSASPHRQFHTLPALLDSWASLPKSYPNASCTMQGGSLYHFMMVFGVSRPGPEPATYRIRDGHANHLANPTRYENDSGIFIQ